MFILQIVIEYNEIIAAILGGVAVSIILAGINRIWKKINEINKPKLIEIDCEGCKGTGKTTCSGCNGNGTVKKETLEEGVCAVCQGSGAAVCRICLGNGTIRKRLQYQLINASQTVQQTGILWWARYTQIVNIKLMNVGEADAAFNCIVTLLNDKRETAQNSIFLKVGETNDVKVTFNVDNINGLICTIF